MTGARTNHSDRIDVQSPVVHVSQQLHIDNELRQRETAGRERGRNVTIGVAATDRCDRFNSTHILHQLSGELPANFHECQRFFNVARMVQYPLSDQDDDTTISHVAPRKETLRNCQHSRTRALPTTAVYSLRQSNHVAVAIATESTITTNAATQPTAATHKHMPSASVSGLLLSPL